ncbi:vitelline membrane outer layer protein 1-like [Mya arenaria]|uniref:vitelline membrane outer layer protein 1-like n=1 Tax=Mya arenaria TaxID=6604 RepID=UPI0022E4CBBA|nr:vitelline membrane outer layer protein 1-like [Mya arenaria]
MMFIVVITLLLNGCYCFVLGDQTPRNVTQQLTVGNGGPFGTWGVKQFCPSQQFAIGYDIKVESYQLTADDTSLNAIKLICADAESYSAETTITSAMGPWGDWKGPATCIQGTGDIMYLSAFSLQVEGTQGSSDDTSANWAKFQCRDMYGIKPMQELNKDPGHGLFGTFGAWSASCMPGSAICGIRTKVEPVQNDGDDTALNDVIFYCCHE